MDIHVSLSARGRWCAVTPKLRALRDAYFDAGLAYYRASEGLSEANVLMTGGAMRMAAKALGRAIDAAEAAIEREPAPMTTRQRQLAPIAVPVVPARDAEGE
jgi:hypothetical protein